MKLQLGIQEVNTSLEDTSQQVSYVIFSIVFIYLSCVRIESELWPEVRTVFWYLYYLLKLIYISS